MESVVKRIFALIWGQHSQGLKSTLKHMKDYEIKVIECDVVWHLKNIKELTSRIDHKTNAFYIYQQTILKFWSIKQGPHESIDTYFMHFNSTYQTLEFAGGRDTLWSDEFIDSLVVTLYDREKYGKRVKVMCLLQRSDPARYSELLTELKNVSYVGNDELPTIPADVYDLLLRRCNTISTQSH